MKNNMKETLPSQTSSNFVGNHFASNNGETSSNNISNGSGNSARKYAVLSTEWISAIGEELGLQQLPNSLLQRLAEDASYRLMEVLHKCVARLRHSKRRKLTSSDVNEVITSLCDNDPVLGPSNYLPEYHSEANVFVPCERIVDLGEKVDDPLNLTQVNAPYLQEMEIANAKLMEARNTYAKRALKTLFNGSQKTFRVLLNDCTTNSYLGGEGVIDKLISIARSTIISNNAQYTRVVTRTCQLIIAFSSNSEAVYPYHLNSVDKLTDLLLKLLLGQSYIHPNLEVQFKDCVLKLMLRWPSVADKYVSTLQSIIKKETKESSELHKKKIMAMEILVGVQPIVCLQSAVDVPFSFHSLFHHAPPGSILWQRIACSISAFAKSGNQPLNLAMITEQFGDSIIPYLLVDDDSTSQRQEPPSLPIIIKSKVTYVNVKPTLSNKTLMDRHAAFPDSTMQRPRREINFAFAGGRPVPPNNLKRVSLRANYQILRSELRATYAFVASRRLLVLKLKRKRLVNAYDLANVHL